MGEAIKTNDFYGGEGPALTEFVPPAVYQMPDVTAGYALPAEEAAGSSPTNMPDANSQHYWGNVFPEEPQRVA